MDLSRFLDAQAPVYSTALAELRSGQKRTHWMWYVLPQLRALGRSDTARVYGLADAAEATAYLHLAILGARLRECLIALLSHRGKSPTAILGTPDDIKFRSCLTLFRAVAAPGDRLWQEALDAFYAGEGDESTLRLLTQPQAGQTPAAS